MQTVNLGNSKGSKFNLAMLLGCTAMVVPFVSPAQAATVIPAKTSWAVSRVASVSEGSYCTMAQKYADATVLTFAQNGRQEYSLALDFKESHFKPGVKTSISLRAQSGAAQIYSITPQSEHAAVIGIGKDSNMMKQIAAAQSVSIEIGKTTLVYSLSEFTTGQKEMGACLAGLQKSNDKTADLVETPKVGMGSMEPVVNRQVAKVEMTTPEAAAVVKPNVSVEGLLNAKPTPTSGATAISSDDVQVVATKPQIAEPVVVKSTGTATSNVELEKLRNEVKELNSQLVSAQNKKEDLEKQLSAAKKQASAAPTKPMACDGDAGQITKRYQESQREITRMGALIQSQQESCTQEKKDIEAKLFDPAIAKNEQIVKLNALEDAIVEKDAKIKSIETDIATAKAQATAESDKKIVELRKQLDQLKADIALKDTNLATLKADLSNKEKAQADAEAKNQQAEKIKADLEAKEKSLADLQLKLDQSEKSKATDIAAQDTTITQLKAQLADVQAKAQQSNAKTSAEQATSLATLQMQVQQGNQKIAELQGQIANMPRIAAAQPQNASVQGVAEASSVFMSMNAFSGLLSDAGVPVKGAIQQVKGGNPSVYRAYSWKTDSLYGSVEMRKVQSSSVFGTVVDQYLGRAKSRCSGEFAAVPSTTKAMNLEQSKSYEIACVNPSSSSSASVLFTYGNGVVMTIAHEGRAESMEKAMDARDKVAGLIK